MTQVLIRSHEKVFTIDTVLLLFSLGKLRVPLTSYYTHILIGHWGRKC